MSKRQSRRSHSVLAESPLEASPKSEKSILNRQNCSTPVSTKWTDENTSEDPYNMYSSPLSISSQGFGSRIEVGWRWDGDSPRQSPLVKRRFVKASPKEDKIEAMRLQRRRAEALKQEKKESGFSKFRADLLLLKSKSSGSTTTSPDCLTETSEESGPKVETTGDMLKFVLNDCESFSLMTDDKTRENSPIAGPSKAISSEKDLLFEDSNLESELCAFDDFDLININTNLKTQESSRKSESEEFYSALDDDLKNLNGVFNKKNIPPAKPASTADPSLRILFEDSFDDLLSQIDGQNGDDASNKSFTRRATMPAKKQNQSGSDGNKGIFRHDSMPVQSSSSTTSTSSSASKCSSEQIQMKRQEALQRLKQSRQQKSKNLKKR